MSDPNGTDRRPVADPDRELESDESVETGAASGSDPDSDPNSGSDTDFESETADRTEGADRSDDRVSDVDSETGVGDNPDDRDPRDENTQIATEERRRNTPFISALVALLGVWIAGSVLVYDVSEAALWNNVLVGAVVFLTAGYNYYRLSNDIPLSAGVATLVSVLGIWLIVSTALLGMLGSLFWSTLVTGLLIAGLSGYNAYEAREARSVATDSDVGS